MNAHKIAQIALVVVYGMLIIMSLICLATAIASGDINLSTAFN